MRNVIDVPYLDQSVRYPTGCESVSAVMLLRYLGYEMSVDEFIEQYQIHPEQHPKPVHLPYCRQ